MKAKKKIKQKEFDNMLKTLCLKGASTALSLSSEWVEKKEAGWALVQARQAVRLLEVAQSI